MLNLFNKFLRCDVSSNNLTVVRNLREKVVKPWLEKNLSEKLAENVKTDPIIDFKVDIGLPPPKSLSKIELKERYELIKNRKNNPEMERKSRTLTLNPDYDAIRLEYMKTVAPKHIKAIAEHYNIYDDLFGDAYFTPYVMMDLYYPQKDENLVAPVCRGNVIKPTEAANEPVVKFSSKPNEMWTLTLVNPDGNLTEENMEYIHWFVGNIPGNNVSEGEIIWDYLPPFPPRGLGFQRFIFILYKQEKKLDYSNLKQPIPCLELKNRNFKTLEFYREKQDYLTPAGLAFFQSDWDKTSRKIFHEVLNMEEPVFEYDIKPKNYSKQKWFPKKQPFDLYLDKFRDPKDIAQEYILKKLKETDPFQPPKNPYIYPRVVKSNYQHLPSWLTTKELRYQMKRGRVTEILRDEYE